MSEIITNKLTGKTAAGDVTITSEGGSATMQLQQGVAKCFIFFDQKPSNVTLDSFNTSSVSDDGAGEASWNITNEMSSVYSSLSGTTARSATHGFSGGGGDIMNNTSQWNIVTTESESQTAEDAEWCAIGHGDLA